MELCIRQPVSNLIDKDSSFRNIYSIRIIENGNVSFRKCYHVINLYTERVKFEKEMQT